MRWIIALALVILIARVAYADELLDKTRREAEQGNASSQLFLGMNYLEERGHGIVPDAAEAFRWVRLAAEQGYAPAEEELGLMYGLGTGVAPDDAAAFKWAQRAAEAGQIGAQSLLGSYYSSGTGVKQDTALAVFWWRRAAEAGVAPAQSHLGMSYLRGVGVPKDEAMGLILEKRAAAQGYTKAQLDLGLYYGFLAVPKDDYESAAWLRLASDKGDPEAQYYLGVALINGAGVVRDDAAGRALVRSAADKGNRNAIDLVNQMQQRDLAASAAFNERILRNIREQARQTQSQVAPSNNHDSGPWEMGMLISTQRAGSQNLVCLYKTVSGFRYSTVATVFCPDVTSVNPTMGTVKSPF